MARLGKKKNGGGVHNEFLLEFLSFFLSLDSIDAGGERSGRMGAAMSALLFQPPDSSYRSNDSRFFQLSTTRGQRIHAFFIDREESHTVLFSHGNAEDIGLVWGWFREVARELKVNVMAYDYTGYGPTEEEPSEEVRTR